METLIKKKILDYVTNIDPNGEVVSLKPTKDFLGGEIHFGKKITQHRVETSLKPEKWIEAYILTKLVFEMGYDATNIELQKDYPAGHPKTTKPRIDIVINDSRKSKTQTFMLIEAKSPEKFEADKKGIKGQLFGLGDHERSKGLKYLVYYTTEINNDKLVDKAIIIDANQYQDYDSWDMNGKPSLDQLPSEYAMALKSIYVNKKESELLDDEKSLDKNFPRTKFHSLRKDLHNVLWGGGGTPDNDVFSNLVKLFLAKIYDEEFTDEGKPYSFQIVYKDGQPQSPSEIANKLNSKEKTPEGQYIGIFRRAQKEYLEMNDQEIESSNGLDLEKVSPNKISYVVERLQSISLTENENLENSDILGEFFEGIVRTGFKQSKGQFFTHTNIVKFCLYGLKLDELTESTIKNENTLPYVVDPSCGSGTFLIEAMKAITSTVKTRNLKEKVHKRAQQLLASWFPPLKENIWARDYIYGIEIGYDLALSTKVNMVLHGDGNINVLNKDGLLDFENYSVEKKVSHLIKKHKKTAFPYKFPVNESFDVIISNPPFSVDLDNVTKRGLPKRFEFAKKRNSENLFIERWYQLLKQGGRMAVVIPEAVLDTRENAYIRYFLFKYFHIKAIVTLPEIAFKPWTSTRTSLLFAVKKNDKDVQAYDTMWRKKDKEFRKIIANGVIDYVRKGDRLVSLILKFGARQKIRISLTGSPFDTLRSLGEFLDLLESSESVQQDERKKITRYREQLDDWNSINLDSNWKIDEITKPLKLLLKIHFDESYESSTPRKILERHWEEIIRFSDSQWWTFIEVSSHFDEEILYFQPQNIGYKRTLNKEKLAPNELFSMKGQNLDLNDTNTILGQLRKEIEY